MKIAKFALYLLVAFTVATSAVMASPNLNEGLVSYLSFAKCDAADDSGSGKNGIIHGATCVDGSVGKSFEFDGVDNYIEIPHPGYLPEGSISGWINFLTIPDPIPEDGWMWFTLAKKPLEKKYDGVVFGVHPAYSPELAFGIYDAEDWHWANSGVVPQNGIYHLAASWGRDGIKVYIDGKLKGSDPYTGGIPRFTKYAFLGANSWGEYVNALIDEVRIYNRAISESEVKALYLEGAPFRYGKKNTLKVDASTYQEVMDPVTKQTFVFPVGGNGVLTTAKIISAPNAPSKSGNGFRFSFSGNDQVQIKIPKDPEGKVQLFSHGYTDAALDGGPSRDVWWFGVPETQVDNNFTTFDVLVPESSVATNKVQDQITATPIPKDYWVNQMKPGDTRYKKEMLIRAQIEKYINDAIDQLDEPLKTAAKDQFREFGFHSNTWLPLFEEGRAYGGIDWWGSYYPYFQLDLSSNYQDEVLAHEVGHYMHHLLLRSNLGPEEGDRIWKIILKSSPSSGHGKGDIYVPRLTITEEPAYFYEQILKGVKPGSIDYLVRCKYPSACDFPSIEGFGYALLGYLMETKTRVGDWNKLIQQNPTVGMKPAEVYGILSQGATNINELREDIDAFLEKQGKNMMLPVVAERLGWTYQVKGRILAANDKKPIANADVDVFIKTGDKEYYIAPRVHLLNNGKSDTDGNFKLKRVFPGNFTQLRITSNGISKEYPITIDWDNPTTQVIDLGDFELDTAPISTVTFGAESKHWFEGNGVFTVETKGSLSGPGLRLLADTVLYSKEYVKVEAKSVEGKTITLDYDISTPKLTNGIDESTWVYPGWVFKLVNIKYAVTYYAYGGMSNGFCSDQKYFEVTNDNGHFSISVPIYDSCQIFRLEGYFVLTYDYKHYDYQGGEEILLESGTKTQSAGVLHIDSFVPTRVSAYKLAKK